MHNYKTIIYIGNGQESADKQAKILSLKSHIPYHGLLDTLTNISVGGYHTSIIDIKPQELEDKIKLLTDVCVVVLDQPEQEFNSKYDFLETINLAQNLEKLNVNVIFQNPNTRNPFYKILNKNKSFCILPFIAIHQLNDKIGTCCLMPKFLTTTQTYTDFKTDTTLNEFRKHLVDGDKVSNCNICYNLEDLGTSSPRITYTINWTNKLNYKSITEIVEQHNLIDYDIRVGNQCNALCRSCNSKNSHLIDVEYNNIGLTKKLYGLESSTDFSVVDLNTIQRLYVAGGEPTISKEFSNFLEKCIKINKTDFEIVVNTNGFVVTERFLNLVSNFNNFKFELSVDGNDLTNYYIRYPISWEKLSANIDRMYNVTNGKVSTNTVMSIYNIGHLYSIINYFEKYYPLVENHLTFVDGIDFMAPSNFPNTKFALADLNKLKTLTQYKTNVLFKSKVDAIIRVIETVPVNYDKLVEFFEFNDRLDASRSVKLADYIPELEACRALITKPT